VNVHAAVGEVIAVEHLHGDDGEEVVDQNNHKQQPAEIILQ